MFQQGSAASFTVIGTCAQNIVRTHITGKFFKFRDHVVLHKAQWEIS